MKYLSIIVTIFVLTNCSLLKPKSEPKEYTIEERIISDIEVLMKIFHFYIPTLEEITFISIPDSLPNNLGSDIYSYEELLIQYEIFHPEKLNSLKAYNEKKINEIDSLYTTIDSINIENGLFQKRPRKSFIVYTNEKYNIDSIYFHLNSNFIKSVFSPLGKNEKNFENGSKSLAHFLNESVLNRYWFKVLDKSYYEKVSKISIKVDRPGFKIDEIKLYFKVLEILGEPLFAGTKDRYEEIEDSIRQEYKRRFEMNNTKLWVKIEGNTIFVSPYLVKAAFISSFFENAKDLLSDLTSHKPDYTYYTDWSLVMVELNKKHKELIYKDPLKYQSIYTKTFSSFLQEFIFIIGHELAHVYMGAQSAIETNEYLCDCMALQQSMNKIITLDSFFFIPTEFHEDLNQNVDPKFGTFEKLLFGSVQNGYDFFWGLGGVDNRSIEDRFNKLELLKLNKIKFDCHD